MIKFGSVELPDPECTYRKENGIEIELRALSTEQKNILVAFYKDDTRGMAEVWTYTNTKGEEWQVRFNESSLVFVMFAQNQWDVTIRLERLA